MPNKNLCIAELVELSLKKNESQLSQNGSLLVTTGERTGRSPNDRFIVEENENKDNIDWGAVNKKFPEDKFNQLWNKVAAHLNSKDYFESEFHVGSDSQYYEPLNLKTEFAWHSLFAHSLFIKTNDFNPLNKQVWQMINGATFKCNPEIDGTNSDAAVIINFAQRKILIAGTQYGGEMKKSMFSVLNYLLPANNILPMHCGANLGQNGDTSLFFGLSGTGKTTLSNDPERLLIGDDEHAWTNTHVFNLEGGCYAKCIDLSQKNEPVIWKAIKFGSVVENVIMDSKTRTYDFNDTSLTKNTRVAYPLKNVELRSKDNMGSIPNAVIFLSCDLTGTLPPVSILNKYAAAYHFLSGYTALVGSTEVGTTSEIQTTFSMCFGAPFFPRPAKVYADLLMQKIEKDNVPVYLVNTGWTGGAYGVGKRFSIPVTRRVIKAIQQGELIGAKTEHLETLNLNIPSSVSGIDDNIVNPIKAWGNKENYEKEARNLAKKFKENIKKFNLSSEILVAGPQ